MDYNHEEWKDIPGFSGRYQASTLGRIKAVGHPRRINHTFVMKPQRRGAGDYLGVNLFHAELGKARSMFVHVLVALTYFGPKPPGMQVNHKDHNKHNNCTANLEYITGKENTRKALCLGVKKSAGKGRCLSPDEVREIRRITSSVPQKALSNSRLARVYGMSHETIRCIRLGKRWKCLSEDDPSHPDAA